MSNSQLIIPERSRDIGGFLVGRLIPFRKKRMVGPFIFIDHMGPEELGPDSYMDIDQHPHIGLATLTYLLQGSMVHRDSIGSNQLITPGSVNWMIAGKGCTHTERTPQSIRDAKQKLPIHGYQIWVALPKNMEDIAPSFHHLTKKELPQWTDNGAHFTLVAGTAFAKASPLPVHSKLFMLDIQTTSEYRLETENNLEGEIGICIIEGSVLADNEIIRAGNMLVSKVQDICSILIHDNTRLLIFGGKPLPEERYISWNFVSHSKDKIKQAKKDWNNGHFPKVANDNTYIPMPAIPSFK